ncbi:MAG: mismatch-specific DNA-glycosylase [Nitriliruptorales bacterium]|nr:mismatch-specific DNA-glycosylase [Nitriliruptorales bacterium]
MGFTRAELEAFRDHTIDDLLGEDCRLLFVGINPGLWTAATNTHFAHPGNRFYPALWRGGITDRRLDPTGLGDEERAHLVSLGIGITNIVARATARASELSNDELRMGGATLVNRVAAVDPVVVAIVGITAYRTAYRLPRAATGRQPPGQHPFGDTECWVVPNPSGLNAHATVDTLAREYRQVAIAAGLRVGPVRPG